MSTPAPLIALDPFLGAAPRRGTERRQALDERLRGHAEDTTAELNELRAKAMGRHATGLAACARAMAGGFARGSRLLVLDDTGGGDAAQTARLFADPPYGLPLSATRSADGPARPGDMVLALFSEAGAADMISTLAVLRWKSPLTVAFAGPDGERLADLGLADHVFVVPSWSSDHVRATQVTLRHVLWELNQHALSTD